MRECGHHRKREIDDRQNPKPPPVAHHLPQSCAELIDANDAVDGEIRRKDIADGLDAASGIASRGQEKPVRKSCGRLVPRKISVGVSGYLNQAPAALAHEARRQSEHRRQRKQLQGIAERGKAVEVWQHDEIKRERRQKNGQMRDAAAEHGRERAASALRQSRPRSKATRRSRSICCRISTKAAGTM